MIWHCCSIILILVCSCIVFNVGITLISDADLLILEQQSRLLAVCSVGSGRGGETRWVGLRIKKIARRYVWMNSLSLLLFQYAFLGHRLTSFSVTMLTRCDCLWILRCPLLRFLLWPRHVCEELSCIWFLSWRDYRLWKSTPPFPCLVGIVVKWWLRLQIFIVITSQASDDIIVHASKQIKNELHWLPFELNIAAKALVGELEVEVQCKNQFCLTLRQTIASLVLIALILTSRVNLVLDGRRLILLSSFTFGQAYWKCRSVDQFLKNSLRW